MVKRIFILGVLFVLCFNSLVLANTSTIEEFGISNINIPQGFSICTRQIVQKEFENTYLKRLDKTYDEWIADVMEPENIYIYASNKSYDSISIRCEKVTQDEIIKYPNGTVDHKLIKDYNIVDSALDKEHLLINYDAYLASRGVSSSDVLKIWWEDEDDLVTPFICVLYKMQNIFYMDMVTIYNGTQLTMMITQKNEFTKAQTEGFVSDFKLIKYEHTPDYSEVKKIVKDNYEITNRQSSDVNDESKNLLYICITVMVLAICYAIELDRKRNSRKTKQKKKKNFQR